MEKDNNLVEENENNEISKVEEQEKEIKAQPAKASALQINSKLVALICAAMVCVTAIIVALLLVLGGNNNSGESQNGGGTADVGGGGENENPSENQQPGGNNTPGGEDNNTPGGESGNENQGGEGGNENQGGENPIVPPVHNHTPAEAVRENEISATCYSEGSYELVVYCSGCGIEILRTTEVVPTSGHSFDRWLNACVFCGLTTTSEGLSYAINGDGTGWTVIGLGSFSGKNLVIPDSHVGLPVTAIADKAFKGISGIESVVIGNNITHIGAEAFMNCSGLKRIKTGEALLALGKHTFKDCTSLVEIYYNSDKLWSEYSLNSTNIEYDNYDYYTLHPFENVGLNSDSLELVVANNVSKIPSGLFMGNAKYLRGDDYLTFPAITTVSFEEGSVCERIGDFAFAGCSKLKNVSVPDSLLHIGDYALWACDNIEFNDYNTGHYLGNENNPYHVLVKSAYYSLDPDEWTEEDAAICIMHNDTVVIASRAFETSCLSKIVVSDSLKSVGGFAFWDAYSMSPLEVHISDVAKWCAIDFDVLGLYYFNGWDLYLNGELVNNLVIPDGVTEIKNYTFEKCISINSVTITKSVTSIGDRAFYSCMSLEGVVIPSSVTSIGEQAFCNCDSLSSVDIQNGVTSIGDQAFKGCDSLKKIIIPNSVISIGEQAFMICKSLVSIEVGSENSAYKSIDGNLYTADGKVLLQNANGKRDAEFIVPDGVTTIGQYAFYGCDSLVKIVISDSVEKIERNAFEYCSSLLTLTIGSGVKEIESQSAPRKLFEIINRSSLDIATDYDDISYNAKEVHSGDSKIVNKDNYLFYTYNGVNYLLGYMGDDTELVLPDDYNGEKYVIYEFAFSGKEITSVAFSGGVSAVEEDAFPTTIKTLYILDLASWCNISFSNSFDSYNLSNPISSAEYVYVNGELLTELVIPDGVTRIADYAFRNCALVSSVLIPDSVTSIGKYAFYNCESLVSVTLGKNIVNIEKYAFGANERLIEVINHSTLNITAGSEEYGDIARNAIEVHKLSSRVVNKDGYVFYMGEDKNYLIVYTGSDTELDLPKNINGESYEIYENAFAYNYNITSVVVPDGVTGIGVSAFEGCCSLEKIVIPNSVTSIGDSAFSWCDSLTSVVIPDSVTSIGEGAFRSCTRLTSIVIPDSVTSIGNSAFYECYSLSSVVIGDSVTTIGDYAFERCTGLTSIVIPDSVTSIGYEAFSWCDSLTSVVIPVSVTSIGERAFYGCDLLIELEVDVDNKHYKSIDGNLYSKDGEVLIQYAIGKSDANLTIPSGVTIIGNYAFSGSSSLKNIIIPNSVTTIGDYAFSYCSSLESIIVPNGVTTIGDYAFYYCDSLVNISVPYSVTNFGKDVFSHSDNLVFNEYDNAYYVGNENNPYLILVKSKSENVVSCIVHNDTIIIAPYAFAGEYQHYSAIESISLPNGLKIIGLYAFYSSKLKSIEIPDSVVIIERGAFSDTYLESVTIGKGVKYIGEYAFGSRDRTVYIKDLSAWLNIEFADEYSTPISRYRNVTIILNGKIVTDLKIPADVTTIGNYAFCGWESLTSVTIPNSVTSIGEKAFYGCDNLENVYIFDISAWLNIDFEKSYSENNNYIYMYSNPMYYAENIYLNGNKVTDLVIPEGITAIPDYAFYNWKSLRSVTIPEGVTTIGDYAFSDCDWLLSLTIPKSLSSVGESIFYNCSWDNLGNLYISDVSAWLSIDFKNNQSYFALRAENIYLNGSPIKEVVIPDGIVAITDHMFRDIKTITSVIIPDSVTSIGNYAFRGCSSLSEIVIPDSVTSIGEGAFRGCTRLTSIVIPDSVTSIGNNAFYECYSLSSVVIGDSVTTIGDDAFSWCGGLTSIVIPDSVTSIGGGAFSWCDGLTSIVIPDSVTSIGNSAFYGCYSLKYNEYDNAYYLGNEDNPYRVLVKAKSYDITSCNIHEDTVIIYLDAFSGCSSLSEIVIPDSVTSIGNSAFFECCSLSSVVIGDSVTTIGDYAFSRCGGLTSIVIPDSVTSIGEGAFHNCTGLRSIVIPDSVTSIGYYAFEYCTGLTSVTIGNSVTSIGRYAFSGCLSLTEVYYTGTEAEWAAIRIHDSGNAHLTNATIHYNCGSEE